MQSNLSAANRFSKLIIQTLSCCSCHLTHHTTSSFPLTHFTTINRSFNSDSIIHQLPQKPSYNKMKKLLPFPILFLFLLSSTLTSSQSPSPTAAPALSVPSVPSGTTTAAAAPAPSGPTSVISILKKDGRFGVLIKLLQSTKVADNIDSQLIDSANGLTVFAPTDAAFSNLKTGTLNSFTDEQKTELVQFHVLPTHISPSQFQTASNPLRTQAGGSTELLAMNVTAVGSLVNITTGETNTSVANTIYDDNQLAVYEVDKVLLPMRFYVPLPPPPPSPPPPKESAPEASPAYASPVDSSTNKCIYETAVFAMACVVLVMQLFHDEYEEKMC